MNREARLAYSSPVRKQQKRLKSLRQIEESESRFRRLIQEAPVAIGLFIGRELIIETPNEAFIEVIGRGPNIVGKPLAEVMPELESQPFLQLLDTVFTSGEPYRISEATLIVSKEGVPSMRYFNVTFLPILNETSAVVSILDISVDITEQVLARQKVEQSENRFRSLIEEAPIATALLVGRELIIEVANQRMIELWGKGNSVLGKPLMNALPELESQHFLLLLDELFTTGKSYEAKAERADLIKEGIWQTFYFNYTFKPVRNTAGDVYAILEMAEDVTEQVVNRKKLEESEERFRHLADDSPMFIFIIDLDPLAPVSYWNKTWLEYTGQTMEEAKGRAWDGIIHPEDVPIVMEQYTPAFQKAQSYLIPAVRVKRYDGIYRWHTFKGNPRYLPNGEFNGYVGVGFDIHEQKITEESLEELVAQRTAELQRSNKELQRSNQNLEEFAHAASHDLKEPIRKIHFFTSQLKEQLRTHLKETEVRSFGRIENATERMGKLIDDLLLYSHVSQRPHQMETIDLNEKLQRVLGDLELDVDEKKAVVDVGKLPVVLGYRRQLQQLFQNLISNALKYSKAGIPPHINIRAALAYEAGKKYHVISVADNGIGFEQQYADKIFQMFSRLHGKAEYSGTGVGLSIVKKVVENHNGIIKVESAPGQGSTFIVFLPAE